MTRSGKPPFMWSHTTAGASLRDCVRGQPAHCMGSRNSLVPLLIGRPMPKDRSMRATHTDDRRPDGSRSHGTHGLSSTRLRPSASACTRGLHASRVASRPLDPRSARFARNGCSSKITLDKGLTEMHAEHLLRVQERRHEHHAARNTGVPSRRRAVQARQRWAPCCGPRGGGARWVLACGPVRWDGQQWWAHYGGAWVDGEVYVTRRVFHLFGRWYRPGDLERVTDALRVITPEVQS